MEFTIRVLDIPLISTDYSSPVLETYNTNPQTISH